MTQLFDSGKGATFSECRLYRYSLWRDWADSDTFPGRCVFIGLNPSTADEQDDDPTIRRCIGFAKAWGFPGMTMLNAYAWRSTDPTGLLIPDDPVGPGNDAAIRDTVSRAELVVCCWGNHCLRERQEKILDVIYSTGSGLRMAKLVQCLGRNASGSPKHPLYLSKATKLERFP